MNPKIRKRLARTVLLSCFALIIGIKAGLFQAKKEAVSAVQDSQAVEPMAGVQVGGPFALTDHTGKKVTQADYTGSYKLIYFGFTYCPAICPTELQKISQAMKKLGPLADQIQPLFITVDPERDTVEVMHDYVSLFHPRLIGLTGARAEIDPVLKDYRVFASKVETEEGNDYTMDHSSFIYLMSPDDELISMYRVQDKADYMAKDITAHLSNS